MLVGKDGANGSNSSEAFARSRAAFGGGEPYGKKLPRAPDATLSVAEGRSRAEKELCSERGLTRFSLNASRG